MRAARPKPWPGSATTFTDAGLPSGRTVTITLTTALLTSSASASGGKGHFQSLRAVVAGRERSGPSGGGGGGAADAVPLPSGLPSATGVVVTALFDLPSFAVMPPAYDVPSPCTIVKSLKSTGAFGSAFAVSVLPAVAGDGACSGGFSAGAFITTGFGAGAGSGAGSSFFGSSGFGFSFSTSTSYCVQR